MAGLGEVAPLQIRRQSRFNLTSKKARPNPRQSNSLFWALGSAAPGAPGRSSGFSARPAAFPSRSLETVAVPLPVGFPVLALLAKRGGVTAAGPLPISTGFPFIARRLATPVRPDAHLGWICCLFLCPPFFLRVRGFGGIAAGENQKKSRIEKNRSGSPFFILG